MVACATNRNNAKNKKMKAIDENVAAVPNNPITEGIEMALPQKDGTTSYGETLAMASGVQTSKKETAGTSHKAGNSADPKSDMCSPWWTGTVGIGGATPSLQKQMKLKEESSETTSVEKVLIMKSTLAYSAEERKCKGKSCEYF